MHRFLISAPKSTLLDFKISNVLLAGGVEPQASGEPEFIKPSHCHGVVILTFANHTVLCKLLKTKLITVQNLVVAERGICARLTFPQHGAGCTKPTAASFANQSVPSESKVGLYVFHKLW